MAESGVASNGCSRGPYHLGVMQKFILSLGQWRRLETVEVFIGRVLKVPPISVSN